MPFLKSIMATTSYQWRGLKCSECDHEFENGEPVYRHLRASMGSIKVIGHLCKNCYESKYIDV